MPTLDPSCSDAIYPESVSLSSSSPSSPASSLQSSWLGSYTRLAGVTSGGAPVWRHVTDHTKYLFYHAMGPDRGVWACGGDYRRAVGSLQSNSGDRGSLPLTGWNCWDGAEWREDSTLTCQPRGERDLASFSLQLSYLEEQSGRSESGKSLSKCSWTWKKWPKRIFTRGCPNLGNRPYLDLPSCKAECLKTRNCNAINWKGVAPGPTPDCVLRGCADAAPVPPPQGNHWYYLLYSGFSRVKSE